MSSEEKRPRRRTTIASPSTSHSRTEPGTSPSRRRTSAGTEICPCAVSLDWARAMWHITTVMDSWALGETGSGLDKARRLAPRGLAPAVLVRLGPLGLVGVVRGAHGPPLRSWSARRGPRRRAGLAGSSPPRRSAPPHREVPAPGQPRHRQRGVRPCAGPGDPTATGQTPHGRERHGDVRGFVRVEPAIRGWQDMSPTRSAPV